MEIRIRRAGREDIGAVSSLLIEAATWVEQLDGSVMWVEDESRPPARQGNLTIVPICDARHQRFLAAALARSDADADPLTPTVSGSARRGWR